MNFNEYRGIYAQHCLKFIVLFFKANIPQAIVLPSTGHYHDINQQHRLFTFWTGRGSKIHVFKISSPVRSMLNCRLKISSLINMIKLGYPKDPVGSINRLFSKFKNCQICQISCDGQVDYNLLILV